MQNQDAIPSAETTFSSHDHLPTPMPPTQALSAYSPQTYGSPTFAPPKEFDSFASGITRDTNYEENSALNSSQSMIPRITVAAPTPPPSTSLSQPWGKTHSWIEPNPNSPHVPYSPFIRESRYHTILPMSPSMTPFKAVPQSAEEYMTALGPMETGNWIKAGGQAPNPHVSHMSGPARDFFPSGYHAPSHPSANGPVLNHLYTGSEIPPQMYNAPLHRRRVHSSLMSHGPAPPSKRMRIEATIPKAPPLPEIIAQAPQVNDIAARNTSALASSIRTAAQLIGRKRVPTRRRKRSMPWGVQRILTHSFIESQATQMGIPIPLISNDDVRTYCQSADTFDPIHDILPPENIDIRKLGDIEISAEELLTFFPNHLKWHDAIYRLAQNNWSCLDMANYINVARDLSAINGKRSNTILKWLQAADKTILGLAHTGSKDRKPWKTTCFSAGSWIPYQQIRSPGLIDYFLVDLADGVMRWPEGEGARLLSRAVWHAVVRGHRDVRLSQVKEYARAHGLLFPPLKWMVGQMVLGKHPDVSAHERFQTMLRVHGGELGMQRGR